MIEVTYTNGKTRQFDILKNIDRRKMAVSLMTAAEMVRFFTPGEAVAMADELDIPLKSTAEKSVCQNIYKYFHG